MLQRIQLPKFPGFTTLIGTAHQGLEDSGLDMHIYRSYGSLGTDHTGCSLDTFGSIGDPLSEDVEQQENQSYDEREPSGRTTQSLQVAEISVLQDEHLF